MSTSLQLVFTSHLGTFCDEALKNVFCRLDCVQQSADLFYEKGYCVTDEPGFYKDGEFGIRIENALYVTDVQTKYNLPEGTKFLKVNQNLYLLLLISF
jgi:Xaa-Pro aminopeptidase